MLKRRLSRTAAEDVDWDSLGSTAVGLNYAEVTGVANDVLKDALIHQRTLIDEEKIRELLDERQKIAEKLDQRQA